jgi:hypothetical protein
LAEVDMPFAAATYEYFQTAFFDSAYNLRKKGIDIRTNKIIQNLSKLGI